MKKGTFKTAVSLAIVGLGAWVLFFRKTHPYFHVGEVVVRNGTTQPIEILSISPGNAPSYGFYELRPVGGDAVTTIDVFEVDSNFHLANYMLV
jgi:hypothetical protein